MRRASFWLLPALVVAVLLLTLVGDVVGVLLSTPARETAILFTARTDFLAAEPTFDLSSAPAPAHPARWQGLALGPGWSWPEPNGTWATGDRAELSFYAVADDAAALVLDCRPAAALPGPQRVAAELNGQLLGTVELADGWASYRLAVPAGAVAAHAANHLVLRFSQRRAPLDPDAGTDPRALAVCCRKIAVTAGDSQPAATAPRTADGDTALMVPRPGLVLVPFVSDDPTAAVSVGYQLPRDNGNSARLHFVLAALSRGEVAELDGRTVTAGAGDSGRVRLSARGRRGPFVLAVRLEAAAATPGAVLREALLEVEPVPPELAVPSWLRGAWRRRGDHPDVVLVVLGGAGADRVGASTRPVAATPSLDRIAASSLAFTSARSAVPAARPALATLLTGLSVAGHGVVAADDELARSTTTLAEQLAAAGYRTLGVAGAGAATGSLGRGFEDFVAAWDGTPSPGGVAGVVEARLATEYDPRPLFLLACLPAQGGDLAAADHALGRIAAALVAHRRPRHTVLVVTGDHGTAAAERDRSLSEAAVRVPLVVRLPDGRRPAGVDLTRPAGLADVAPTILAAAGVAVPSAMSGVDLVGSERLAERALLLRSPSPPVLAGVVLGSLKLVADPLGRRELYDLAVDPDEQHDLAPARPLVVAMLTHLAERGLDGPAATAAAP